MNDLGLEIWLHNLNLFLERSEGFDIWAWEFTSHLSITVHSKQTIKAINNQSTKRRSRPFGPLVQHTVKSVVSVYDNVERTAGYVLVAPLDHQHVVAPLLHQVAHAVLVVADVTNAHFLTWQLGPHHAHHQHVDAYHPPTVCCHQSLRHTATLQSSNIRLDAAYCYSQSSVICVSVCLLCLCWSQTWALQKQLSRQRCFWDVDSWCLKSHTLDGGGGESPTGPGTHEWDIMGQTAAEWCCYI